jgi:hypothetical protein
MKKRITRSLAPLAKEVMFELYSKLLKGNPSKEEKRKIQKGIRNCRKILATSE